jgi:hypothetical protein
LDHGQVEDRNRVFTRRRPGAQAGMLKATQRQGSRCPLGIRFQLCHAASLPEIATPFGLAMTIKKGGLAMT